MGFRYLSFGFFGGGVGFGGEPAVGTFFFYFGFVTVIVGGDTGVIIIGFGSEPFVGTFFFYFGFIPVIVGIGIGVIFIGFGSEPFIGTFFFYFGFVPVIVGIGIGVIFIGFGGEPSVGAFFSYFCFISVITGIIIGIPAEVVFIEGSLFEGAVFSVILSGFKFESFGFKSIPAAVFRVRGIFVDFFLGDFS